jgi:anhydro-N-acetylmuramic acid kinase
MVTDMHIEAVKAARFTADIIGFHGQTITHDPANGFTWQLGDGSAMANALGITVVSDFRSADMVAGGQGAPLAPLYHKAIMVKQDHPLCVLNLGGVANVTYVGEKLLAFDCGPANALMDDYMNSHLSIAYDAGGMFASAGEVDMDVVAGFLARDYFLKAPPKSLDRNDFASVMDMLPADPQDAMATLAELTIQSVMKARAHFPVVSSGTPKTWYVCGGGRHNGFIMQRLEKALGNVHPIEAAGFNGDAIEAECFAYLAVRSLLGLPISLPETTAVPEPKTGGRVDKP